MENKTILLYCRDKKFQEELSHYLIEKGYRVLLPSENYENLDTEHPTWNALGEAQELYSQHKIPTIVVEKGFTEEDEPCELISIAICEDIFKDAMEYRTSDVETNILDLKLRADTLLEEMHKQVKFLNEMKTSSFINPEILLHYTFTEISLRAERARLCEEEVDKKYDSSGELIWSLHAISAADDIRAIDEVYRKRRK